jgi:hypothetical protein
MDDSRLDELARKRAKLDKKPRYGTVGTKIYVPGAPGLADTEPVRWEAGQVWGVSQAAYAAADGVVVLGSQSAPSSPAKASANQTLTSRTP